MAKRRGNGRRKSAAAPGKRLIVEGPLRLRMLELHAEIGLFPGESPEPRKGRNKRRGIYDEQGPTPEGLSDCFPGELAALRGLGKPADRAYAIELDPYRIFCLPFYYYDGLYALLYVEEQGAFLAAWCEQEMENPLAPHDVIVNGSEEDFQAFLRHASLAAQR